MFVAVLTERPKEGGTMGSDPTVKGQERLYGPLRVHLCGVRATILCKAESLNDSLRFLKVLPVVIRDKITMTSSLSSLPTRDCKKEWRRASKALFRAMDEVKDPVALYFMRFFP